MKNRALRNISFILTLGLLFSACESDIDKANKDYDFDAIVPVVQGVTGPTSVNQTFTEKYTVNYFRGGSTWDWTVEGATIDSLSSDTRSAYVHFGSVGTVKVTVTETTQGGVSSDPFTYSDITVNKFCPMTRDDFLGTWSGTETEDTDDDIQVTFVAGDAANEIKVEAIDGIPGFQSSIFEGWGETFQAGFGEVGDITLVIQVNGAITLNHTYWGQTLPGPYDYWYLGSGNWDGCNGNGAMEFDFIMDWSGDGSTAYLSHVSLTKD